MEDIITLINKELKKLSTETKEHSLTINNLRQVALRIGIKRNEYNVDKLIYFIDHPNTLEQCLNEVPTIFDVKTLIKIIKSHESYLNEIKRRNRIDKKNMGGNFKIISDYTKENVLKCDNEIIKKGYAIILENDERLQKLESDVLEILGCFCFSVVSKYNLANQLRENNYKKAKTLKYALERILKNETLLPHQHALIVELISDKVDEDKLRQKLFSDLEKYVNDVSLSFNKKTAIPSAENNAINDAAVKNEVCFVDDQAVEAKSERDERYLNYLSALKSFDNYNDTYKFLKAIEPGCNLKIMLYNMINHLGTSKEDELLKAYLTEYCFNLENNENNENLDNDNEGLVLYYGVLDNKNDVLNDVKERVPQEYYKDVLKAINIIKSNDVRKYKSSYFESLKKVFKVRVNDIRISYKHICQNVYVILGVFCKKDHHGGEVANVSKRRNQRFVMDEELIIELLSNDYFRADLMAKNDELEQQLFQLLKSKIK